MKFFEFFLNEDTGKYFFNLSVTGVSFLVFSILLIAGIGYLLGRITIKGVNLGTAGVFLVALLFGCLFFNPIGETLDLFRDTALGEWWLGIYAKFPEWAVNAVNAVMDWWPNLSTELSGYTNNALKIVENIGLILFVTSVGFIAGPKFFGNLKKNFTTYILLGLVIIVSGALVCAGCILLAKFTMKAPAGVEAAQFKEQLTAIMTGLFSGALTSTPAFSASKEAIGSAELQDYVAVGNGIAYIFGVIGVVLFVQLIPKFMKADMAAERAKLVGGSGDTGEDPVETKSSKKLIDIDPFGIAPFVVAAIIGMLIGTVKIGSFSLTTTGGCLLVALIFGHFGRIGKINIMPPAATLKVFRELGLMLFLIGAGVAGGAKFIECFQPIYFLYGALMTIIPMIIGFLFAKFVLKLNLLNSLGSITGGMTSTPALGTLIQVSGTEDVGASYAATYPIALISVVLASQILIMIF